MNSDDISPIRQQNLLSRLRVYLSILAIICAGPIVVGLPPDLIFIQYFATRFGLMLFILGLWELLLQFITKYVLAPNLNPSKVRKFIVFLLSFLLSAIILYSAGHLEDKITHSFLLLFLITLGVRAFAQGLKIADYQRLRFVAMMIYLLALSILSCAITSAGWHWPFIFVGLALQAGLHSDFCLKQLVDSIKTDQPNTITHSPLFWSRLHSFTLIYAPVSIALLQYLNLFSKSYLICLFALTPMLRSAEISTKIEKRTSNNLTEALTALSRIQLFSSASTILFIFCFALALYIEI